MIEGKTCYRLTSLIVTVFMVVTFGSCIYDYEGDCSVEIPSTWHKADVKAGYNTEWEVPITPRMNWEKHWPESIGVSYSALRPAIPSGLRMVCYNGHDPVPHLINMAPQGGEIDVPGGVLDVLFYNNDTEYIVFENINHFSEVTATTRLRMRASYKGNTALGTEYGAEPTVSAPDMLFTTSMTGYRPAADSTTIEAYLEPVVFSYAVHFKFERGLEHVVLARGTLTGMAAGVNMHTRTTLHDRATILYDCTPHDGGITAIVHSFGVPDYRVNDEHPDMTGRYGITLEMLLDNGKTITRDFDVSSQVAVQPAGGVIMVGNISITEEESKPPTGGGAFDVDVADWGDNEDIYIDF